MQTTQRLLQERSCELDKLNELHSVLLSEILKLSQKVDKLTDDVSRLQTVGWTATNTPTEIALPNQRIVADDDGDEPVFIPSVDADAMKLQAEKPKKRTTTMDADSIVKEFEDLKSGEDK